MYAPQAAPLSHNAEANTRWIARAGSVVAAGLLAFAFATDNHYDAPAGPEVVAFTAFVLVMVGGYLLAWKPRWEVVGSVVAIVGVVAAYFAVDGPIHATSDALLLGCGLPALAHLVAVALHREPRRHTAA